MRVWMSFGFLFAVLAPGCSGALPRVPPDQTLPFTVKVKKIQLLPGEIVNTATPALFTEQKALTRLFAQSLQEAGVFSRVVTEDESKESVDLELEIKVDRYDFGASQTLVGGAVFSTLAWMFLGATSWFIDNREYPDSLVSLRVSLRHPTESGARPETEIYEDEIALKGLQLNFSERADPVDWFWNLFLPPWLDTGNPDRAGRSLVERTPRFFGESAPPRLLSQLPNDYLRHAQCFLGYDPGESEAPELVVVSRADVIRIAIRAEGADTREIGEEELGRLEVIESEQKANQQDWFRDRVHLVIEPSDQYFRIPLFDGERGFVRIEAEVAGSTPRARWTIYRPLDVASVE